MQGASKRSGALARLRASLPYAAVLVAAVALYALAGRFQYAPKPGQLGPDVWPKAILALAIAVCALQIAWQMLRPVADRTPAAVAQAEAEQEAPPRLPHLLAAGTGLSLAYVAVLQTIGFFVATAAYLALFMVFGRYRKPLPVAATSLLGSLAFVFVFMKVVYVSLPLGTGPFQAVSIWILRLVGVH